MRLLTYHRNAFSLVELSIVLVILGLLVGGVLAGKDLIRSATVKSQISQISEVAVASRAFQDKYFALPGDFAEPTAASAGFTPRGPFAGMGDGNGILEGVWQNAANRNAPEYQSAGETVLFWRDLSQVGLISGSFTTASATTPTVIYMTENSNPRLDQYYPRGKLPGTYIFVSGAPTFGFGGNPYPMTAAAGKNYIHLGRINDSGPIGARGYNGLAADTNYGVTVAQAYAMDNKLGDGKPASGKVIALLSIYSAVYSLAGGPGATAPGIGTCGDNQNNAANEPTYSMSFNNGESPACALLIDM